jgi:hypothetical protein
MTHKLVEPGDDARAAERVVALITRYAVRFDPVGWIHLDEKPAFLQHRTPIDKWTKWRLFVQVESTSVEAVNTRAFAITNPTEERQ